MIVIHSGPSVPCRSGRCDGCFGLPSIRDQQRVEGCISMNHDTVLCPAWWPLHTSSHLYNIQRRTSLVWLREGCRVNSRFFFFIKRYAYLSWVSLRELRASDKATTECSGNQLIAKLRRSAPERVGRLRYLSSDHCCRAYLNLVAV
jgi:hypothetical protein